MKLGTVSNRKILQQTALLLLCGVAGWYLKGKLTPSIPMGAGGAGETYVLIQGLENADISSKHSYIGHVEAIKSVNLIPQVSGYVEQVLFQEGSDVQEGGILFMIEQKRYLANVELRKAELESAKANLVRAERDFKRQAQLSKQNYASKATFDTAESTYLQAKAAVSQAEANLDLAEIDLGYTEIKAPISGFIGKALVTEGNYVSSSAQNLARIVQTNPIRVAFSVSDKEYLDSKLFSQQNGEHAIRSEIVLPNGKVIENHFQSRFTDNEINSDTATIAVYAEYKNDENLLIPGNYVDIKIGPKESQEALLVPQSAIAQDEHGNYVMVVKDNIAEQRRVTLGDTIGTKQIVKSGLSIDDKVIIQGLQKVTNGSKVKAELIKNENELNDNKLQTPTQVEDSHPIAQALQAPEVDVNSPMLNSSAPVADTESQTTAQTNTISFVEEAE